MSAVPSSRQTSLWLSFKRMFQPTFPGFGAIVRQDGPFARLGQRAKTGITATRSPTIAEHDMQAKRGSGKTDAQTALAIGMKVVEEYRRRAAEVDRLAQEAISEDHKRRILDIARAWRELADQREALLTKRDGVSAPPNEKSPSRQAMPEDGPGRLR